MINIDCKKCSNHCCGSNLYLTPVLLPSEEKRFKEHSQIVKTLYRDMQILAKKENGNCIFLDDRTIRCTIYDSRPLECQLYPFLLEFRQGKPDVRLDRRFCPHLSTLQFDSEKIAALIQKQKFPKDWINAYKTLDDY